MAQMNFALPDASTLRTHVQEHAPRPRPWQRFVVPGVLAAGLVVLFMTPATTLGSFVPWAMLAAMFIWIANKRRDLLLAQQGVRQVQELTALRRPMDAIQVAWHLLPNLAKYPDMFVQGVMLLGSNLMAVRAWDPAIEAQSFLLEHVPAEHPTGRMIRAQRLLALLHDERLADADAQLRNLQRVQLDPIAASLTQLAQLYQQVKTHHDVDAIASFADSDPQRVFAPLGTEAGYGYAMLALAAYRTQQHDMAAVWWRRATLLIPPHDLELDLPELATLRELTPAAGISAVMREDGLG